MSSGSWVGLFSETPCAPSFQTDCIKVLIYFSAELPTAIVQNSEASRKDKTQGKRPNFNKCHFINNLSMIYSIALKRYVIINLYLVKLVQIR